MRVVLLAPTPPDISAFGLRALSADLKAQGHQVRSIFLPGGIDRLRRDGEFVYRYSEPVLKQVVELCGGADLVGISFMSLYWDRAVALTRAVRERTGVPVIWGGTHASVRPRISLEEADYVCIGEGEGAIRDLLDRLAHGGQITDLPNILGREAPDQTPTVRPLIQDLDSLPPPDFDLEEQYLHDPRTDRIVPITPELLAQALPLMPDFGGRTRRVYRTMTTRGCPHRCSYCVNAFKAGLNPGETYLRRRSTGHVIQELESVIRRFSFIQGIHFFDDVFTSAPRPWLEEFARRYRDRIDRPFYCQVSPATIDQERLELLLEAGMIFIELGIQTGSEKERQLYNREESEEQTIRAARLFHRYRDRLLVPRYHVILDSPWASPQDGRATVNLLTRLPRPFRLCLASLTLYPGTELAERATREGLLVDEIRQVLRKPFYRVHPTYLNFLVTLCDVRWIPRSLLRTLSRAGLVGLLQRPGLERPMAALFRLNDGFRLVGKGLGALGRGQVWRIFRYFRRTR